MSLLARSLIIVLLLSTFAFAEDDKTSGPCEKALTGARETPPNAPAKANARSAFKIVPSERAPGDAAQYEEYVEELVAPGGVLDQLGIEMTGQVVEFVTPRDLNALTSGTAGGYPVSHYLDGAAVMKSLNPTRGFALEVVYPGPDYQHGFYRDDNPVNEQFSIIDHVVGHNNFAYTSGLAGYRYGQGMVATRKIDELFRTIYEHEDKDTVQRYYLWALTLSRLWDWYAPLLEPSKDFEPNLKYREPDLLGRRKEVIRHPGRVTENIHAAFAANIDAHEPGWKKQILEHLFTSMSFRPPLVHTQIMNEGWASIMQEIIPKYTKDHHTFSYWFGASRVMQTETMPKLQDPYSLGVVCWRRIRERFFQQPEIAALKTPIEKDRAFIAHASEIIATTTDEGFLRLALDQTMVDRLNLSVVQKVPRENWKNMGAPPDQQNNWQWKVVSKDARRVAQMIIDRVVKPKYFFNPRVKLVDFNRPGSGEVELILDDEVGVNFPLKKDELGPALYAMANVIGKPISLICTVTKGVLMEGWAWNPIWGPVPPDFEAPQQEKLIRARIVVAPNGDLKAYRIDDPRAKQEIASLSAERRALNEEFDQKLTDELANSLGAYIEDLYLEDEREMDRVFNGSTTLRNLHHQAISKMIEATPYDGMVSHSPNSAGAIIEYKSMLERRLARALERAAKQKGGLSSGPGGMRVKALPSVVNLQYDMEYIKRAKNELTTTTRAMVMNLNRTEDVMSSRASPFNPDEGNSGSVGPIRGEEGDHFWGPGDNGGQGQQGTEAGEGEEDLSWVELPEGLYEKFIGERVKLPILNRKPGQSKMKATRAGGRVRRKQGILLPDEIVNNAMKRGVGGLAGEGIDPFEDLSDTLEEGFARLQPRDIVVKSRVPDKKPDVRAVVTFVLDASGSTASYYEAFKRFVYDIEALVKHNYKGVEFRYVVFDDEAHVMKNKNEFFRAKLGGGTDYSSGIVKAKELFEKNYPRASWDRYTFLLGDMEDFSPAQAMQNIQELLEQSEYFGAVAGLHGGGRYAQLHRILAPESQTNEQLGYTVIDEDGGYRIDNIKEVLKNKTDE